jgi:hypothetical protein
LMKDADSWEYRPTASFAHRPSLIVSII